MILASDCSEGEEPCGRADAARNAAKRLMSRMLNILKEWTGLEMARVFCVVWVYERNGCGTRVNLRSYIYPVQVRGFKDRERPPMPSLAIRARRLGITLQTDLDKPFFGIGKYGNDSEQCFCRGGGHRHHLGSGLGTVSCCSHSLSATSKLPVVNPQ